MKAVIYARYSSGRQHEESIERQLEICTKYAEENDMLLVGSYIDRRKTGKNDNRPDFQRKESRMTVVTLSMPINRVF